MVDTELSGRVAVVTGANNPDGIGAATARALAKQGCSVFLHFYRPESVPNTGEAMGPSWAYYQATQTHSAEEIVDSIRSAGQQAACFECDFSSSEFAGKLFDQVERTLGLADILVNNAAAYEPDSFAQSDIAVPLVTAASFDWHFGVNARAPALLMAEFAARRIRRAAKGGAIINISTDGASGHAGAVSYGASKSALESYSRAAAWELGPIGITVNVLALGPVQTGWITPELEQALIPKIPVGRIGNPDDVADVVVFFASKQARWITGQVLYVGGGKTMSQ